MISGLKMNSLPPPRSIRHYLKRQVITKNKQIELLLAHKNTSGEQFIAILAANLQNDIHCNYGEQDDAAGHSIKNPG
jgi:hypothetical protein